MSAGAVIVGTVVSSTKICCKLVAMFPASSITTHVIVVNPNGKNSGASFATDATPTRSSAYTPPKSTTFWVSLVASTVILFGTLTVGEVVSTIVTT